jgi:hypothetical protein
MPPLSSNSAGYDDVIEIQHHLVHLNADHHHHHHKSLVESINALLHVGGNGKFHFYVSCILDSRYFPFIMEYKNRREEMNPFITGN